MYFGGEFELPLYSNFEECVDDIRAGNRPEVPEEEVEKYNKIYEKKETKQALQFIEYFEKNYQCSGVCESAMFFYTLPMSEGPPDETCMLHMK